MTNSLAKFTQLISPSNIPDDVVSLDDVSRPRRPHIWDGVNHDPMLFAEALVVLRKEFTVVIDEDDQVLVGTDSLYPFFDRVFISITAHANSKTAVRVSDARQANGLILNHSVDSGRPGEWLAHYARRWDVKYSNGEVYSSCERSDFANLSDVIRRVAQASRDAAAKHIEEHKPALQTKTVRTTMQEYIVKNHFDSHLKPRRIGGTKRVYNLKYVHLLADPGDAVTNILGDNALVLEPVLPHEKSIEAKSFAIADLMEKWNGMTCYSIYDPEVDVWENRTLRIGERLGLEFISLSDLKGKLPALIAQRQKLSMQNVYR